MSERLLSITETAQRLDMSTRSFARHKAKLVAMGLQTVKIGQYAKFRESSLDRVIQRLAENGESKC
jgi:hypothetical protein